MPAIEYFALLLRAGPSPECRKGRDSCKGYGGAEDIKTMRFQTLCQCAWSAGNPCACLQWDCQSRSHAEAAKEEGERGGTGLLVTQYCMRFLPAHLISRQRLKSLALWLRSQSKMPAGPGYWVSSSWTRTRFMCCIKGAALACAGRGAVPWPIPGIPPAPLGVLGSTTSPNISKVQEGGSATHTDIENRVGVHDFIKDQQGPVGRICNPPRH